MKLLLTSAGIKNTSIHEALVDLLGKPIAESSALCIPTAVYAIPGGASHAWRFFSGQATTPMCELGWKSLGVLELTALPSIDEAIWVPMVQETDVLLVNGGDPMYLCYWMRQSGLADLLPSLDTVYVGLSAGSLVMTPNIGEDFVRWTPPTGGDETLGMVGFSIFPHLDHPDLPDNSMAEAERWAAGMTVPAYAIDDETAIRVTGCTVDVISEGHWKLGVRDYVHVVDLAHGHLKALEKLRTKPGLVVNNLGTGCGYSVLEAVAAFSKACGRPISNRIVGRRPGDVAISYADPSLAQPELDWRATRGLAEMCIDACIGRPPIPPGMQILNSKFVADCLCFLCLFLSVVSNH